MNYLYAIVAAGLGTSLIEYLLHYNVIDLLLESVGRLYHRAIFGADSAAAYLEARVNRQIARLRARL